MSTTIRQHHRAHHVHGPTGRGDARTWMTV
jgi:hypothetical protein